MTEYIQVDGVIYPYTADARSKDTDGYIELTFHTPVNQEQDEPLDTINVVLERIYCPEEIDWRDETTCWIHLVPR